MTPSTRDDAPQLVLDLESARFLLGALGDAALWRWLCHRDRAALRGEITKGFKNAPGALRHGLAQTRLARHLQRHEKDFQSLLKLWAPSQNELLRAVQNASAAARVLAPDATQESPGDSNAETDSVAPTNFDLPEEVTQSLRARFGENALQLAQLYLDGAPPDAELFSETAPRETASTRDETEIAAATLAGDEATTAAPYGAASTRGAPSEPTAAERNAASTRSARENQTTAESLAGASTHEAPPPPSPNSQSTIRDPQSNDAAREALQRQLHAAKAARDAGRQRARELSAEIETLKARHQRESHELRAQFIQAQKDAETQREKASAAQKTLERETRRAKRETAQLETFEAENKSLKRQLRQSQQSAEEARKTAAAAIAQLQRAQQNLETLEREIEVSQREKIQVESHASTRQSAARGAKKAAKTPRVKAERVAIQAVKVAPLAPRVLDPLDEVFRWNAASGDFAVTLRETREMISRNDERRVFALSRALETLRESDEKTYWNFLARVREFGVYFRRVLTASTTRVLVDASNVARLETDRRGRGRLDFLLQAREELRRRDAFPLLLVADASLQHFIDEPAEVAKLAARGELELLPAGSVADDFLAREARRTGAFVLTNDKGFHKQVAPDFEPSRIGFRLRHHFIEIDDF